MCYEAQKEEGVGEKRLKEEESGNLETGAFYGGAEEEFYRVGPGQFQITHLKYLWHNQLQSRLPCSKAQE